MIAARRPIESAFCRLGVLESAVHIWSPATPLGACPRRVTDRLRKVSDLVGYREAQERNNVCDDVFTLDRIEPAVPKDEVPQNELMCSFCRKSQSEVAKLVTNTPGLGPRVCICNECIEVCRSILEDSSKVTHPKSSLS